MLRLAQPRDQPAIVGVADVEPAGLGVALHDRLGVVEDQQAAPFAQQPQQQLDLVGDALGRGGLLARDHMDQAVEQIADRRGVAQRAEDHHLELHGDLAGEPDRQAGLADAAQAQQRHHAAAVGQHPLDQGRQLGAAAIQRRHIDRLAPVKPRGRVGERESGEEF